MELIDACFIQRKFVTASMKRPFAQYDEDSVREFRKRMEEFVRCVEGCGVLHMMDAHFVYSVGCS